ncbi:hypothetical protein KAT80_03120 [Candidatus Pacearchaeota archaeon]|nr:hypothetical protein [Candidatus Pacearchaeota archaeon]
MKFNFRKISAIGSTLLLTGMSIATPIAASAYPQPFISAGTANVAIVYGTGTGVSALDVVESGNIQSNLQAKMGTSVGTTSIATGEAKSLNSGSDLLYLLDKLSENVGTITKSDLPTILADGDFLDDDGGSWEFEQTIVVGTNTGNRFSFGNSDNDFDDPALMLELQTSTSNPMYTWTLSFDKATPLNATASEGEEITIFGKKYTVGTATDGDTLILLGGADAQKVMVGEAVTMTVDGTDYTVTLDGLSSATETVASITIDSSTKTFTQGQTKTFTIDGVELEVFVKTVFRTGDDGSGHIEIELGADKMTFESGNAVQYGSSNTDIDGTLVTLTGTANNVMGSLTKIEVAVAAEDSDANHILVGGAFTDPVFETLKLELTGVLNGPVFEDEQDTGRTLIELTSGGSRELQVVMTDSAGVTKTIPFTYDDIMQDDSRNPFITVEGNNLTDDDYFFLNSGDYQHLMKVTKVNLATNAANSDLEIQDVFTGTKYLIENKDFSGGQNVTVNSQTYVLTNDSSGGSTAGFKVESEDCYQQTHRALFPYMELVAGEDFPRVTFINTTNLINDATGDIITVEADGALVEGREYEVPTGSFQFRVGNFTANVYAAIGITAAGAGSATWTNMTAAAINGTAADIDGGLVSVKVGEAYYIVGFDSNYTGAGATTKVTIKNITGDYGFDVDTTDSLLSPAIMYVEDKDKSDSEARNVILINTTDDATYSEMSGDVLFSGTSQHDDETWDDTKLKGYLTNYGTYALRDQTDTNIHIASLSYGAAQMYADVYLAEVEATITAGTTAGGASQIGNILVKDSEVSSVATKNLIVVGGSCINSAAASLVGGSYCGAAWTTATNVGTGEFLIKGYSDSTITNKLALLVAGYNVADTVNAATYLRNQALDTSKEYKGTSSTSATLVTTETA